MSNAQNDTPKQEWSLLGAVDMIVAILQCLDDGEITPEAERELEALDMTIEQKVEAYHLVRCRLTAESEVCCEEARRLRARADARDKARARLEKRLLCAIDTLGVRSIKTPTTTCYQQDTQSVLIEQPEQVPDRYVVTEITKRPNKRVILERMKEGETIPGCVLKTTTGIRFR